MQDIANSIIEIDRKTIIENMQKVWQHVGPNVEVMAVLKGNACGHGLVEMGQLLTEECGVRYLGVAQVVEAKRLLEEGISPNVSILVMGGIPDLNLPYAIEKGLLLTIFRKEAVHQISRIGARYKKAIRVHIKIDTGLGRIGVYIGQELEELLNCLRRYSNLVLDGVYSHFSDACYDESLTKQQLALFQQGIEQIHSAGFYPKHIHIANTGATICWKDTHFNMVRTGLSWLGYDPSKWEKNRLHVEPAIRWISFLTNIRSIPANTPIGYGRSIPMLYTRRDCRIAIASFGYSDGYPSMCHGGKGYVLLHGKRAPVVQVNMDQTFLDITEIPQAKIGDMVTLLGRDGEETLNAVELANCAGTLYLELLSGITTRPLYRYI